MAEDATIPLSLIIDCLDPSDWGTPTILDLGFTDVLQGLKNLSHNGETLVFTARRREQVVFLLADRAKSISALFNLLQTYQGTS